MFDFLSENYVTNDDVTKAIKFSLTMLMPFWVEYNSKKWNKKS